MKCPYCKDDMLKGYIPTYSIDWIPEFGSMKLKYSKDKTNGFRIGRHRFFVEKKQSAYYCPKCDKIIIDCKDTEPFESL